MKRDTQRTKLYRAEAEVIEQIHDKRFPDKIATWAFVERVERSKWFRRHYGRRRFRLTLPSHGAYAHGGYDRLTLPPWSRRPMNILHEIAHCVTPVARLHDWRFAHAYLALVRHFMGAEVHRRLRAAFRKHHVRYTAPRRTTMSEEQREAARRRMTALNLIRETNKGVA